MRDWLNFLRVMVLSYLLASPSSKRFLVRKSRSSDYEAWNFLWKAYLDFYNVTLPAGLDEITWQRLAGAESEQECMLCEDEQGQIVGFIIIVFHRSSWAQTWNCLIEDVFVSDSHRGYGIGRLLFDAVFEVADSRACYRTYWQTDRDNSAARMLYDKIGNLPDVVQYRRN